MARSPWRGGFFISLEVLSLSLSDRHAPPPQPELDAGHDADARPTSTSPSSSSQSARDMADSRDTTHSPGPGRIPPLPVPGPSYLAGLPPADGRPQTAGSDHRERSNSHVACVSAPRARMLPMTDAFCLL
jgi:hypothetical protein